MNARSLIRNGCTALAAGALLFALPALAPAPGALEGGLAPDPSPPARARPVPARGDLMELGALGQGPQAEKLFKAQCAPCHGAKGRGDGPVAAALQPKPTDLTNPEFQAGRTDEELREAITSGKGAMPGFGKVIAPDEIDLLVAHVRSLAQEKK